MGTNNYLLKRSSSGSSIDACGSQIYYTTIETYMALLRKISTFLCAALVAAWPAVAQDSKAAPGVSASQIKIGMHLSMSGPASFLGHGLKVGIDPAVAEINAHGGVNGRRLSYAFVDDRGAPDGGVTAARRVVESEVVFLVPGGGTSTSTVATLPYFSRSPDLGGYKVVFTAEEFLRLRRIFATRVCDHTRRGSNQPPLLDTWL